jgi:GTP pyrophosphokinase
MDRDAVYGIVAGFRFARRGAHAARSRRGAGRGQRRPAATPGRPDHLDWLRNLVQWQERAVDPMRFIESLRCDLSEDQVHIFIAGVGETASPADADYRQWAGTRLLLPAGATPVDVAYALGSDIGDRCLAATVNGQLAFLSSPLTDGDVVEIHTQDRAQSDGPSAEWLGFVRTPQAQLHIEKRLGVRDDPRKAPPLPLRDRARIGLNAIRMELHWRERRLANERLLHTVTAALGYPDVPTLCVAVADHVIAASEVAELLIDQVEGPAVLPELAEDPILDGEPGGRTAVAAAP